MAGSGVLRLRLSRKKQVRSIEPNPQVDMSGYWHSGAQREKLATTVHGGAGPQPKARPFASYPLTPVPTAAEETRDGEGPTINVRPRR